MGTLNTDTIFEDILTRLPAKSLIRFKCVSKPFQASISSPHFTQQYLLYHYLSSNANDLLTIPVNQSISCHNLNSCQPFVFTTFTWHDRSISIIGSSKGLLCVLAINDIPRLSIINPTTQISMNVGISKNGERGHNLGFAFDYVNLDFKIVAISDYYLGPGYKIRTTRVYSLNTNAWMTVDNPNPLDSMEVRGEGALIDSHLLHWIFQENRNASTKARIGCFNACTMKWVDDVLFPRFYYNRDNKNVLFSIGVFDDSLFASFDNPVNSCFDVWVMKVYGAQDSWFKLLSVPIKVVPITRRGSDEILIQALQQDQNTPTLFWYNHTDGGMSKAEFSETPTFSNLQVYICGRSIIDIPRGEIFGT